MDENYAVGAQAYPPEQIAKERSRRLDITLRQNIDERIRMAQANVVELEATKERMEKSGILDMRIEDIRRAMQF